MTIPQTTLASSEHRTHVSRRAFLKGSAICRGQMNINHLHLTEGLYHGSRGQAPSVSFLQISECDKKAIR